MELPPTGVTENGCLKICNLQNSTQIYISTRVCGEIHDLPRLKKIGI